MIPPRQFKQYYSSGYPEIKTDQINFSALLNNVDLSYGDYRDMERKSVDIDESSAGELTARSVSLRNLLLINQYDFWKALGWSSLSVVSIDYEKWASIASIFVLLKDFTRLLNHKFSPVETNVLYAIYLTGTPDNPYFTKSELEWTYSALFNYLSPEKLKSVLDFFCKVQVIDDEGARYAIRQEIRLNRWQFR